MSHVILAQPQTKRIYRAAVSCLFFLQGLCFASWASRIPSIQQNLQLSDTALGIVLFALPVGSMLSLPFAGWLVNRFGSKRIAVNSLLLYSVFLVLLGVAQNVGFLLVALVGFGIAGNLGNIAINTQAVGVEERYERNIMASFHGLWSIAGFLAAGIGAYMIGNTVTPLYHFSIIAGFIAFGVAITFSHLLSDEVKETAKAKLFSRPDRNLVILGVIAFCCMICEGAMFDWSGIYFQKVVLADANWIGAGYTAFMSTMALGRFLADWVVEKLGFKRTIRISGILITSGLLLAVTLPYLVSALAGFLLVGLGVSSVVPLVYSEAGRSKTMNAGNALTAVSSIGFLGFLFGPPLIGVIAGLFSLRISFLLIALIGIGVVAIVGKVKKSQDF